MRTHKVAFFWFRRDLRLEDNVGLYHALSSTYKVVPLFIFDENILETLPKDDSRVTFIHLALSKLNNSLKKGNSSLLIKYGTPLQIWKELLNQYNIAKVFFNHDYEPYALERDKDVTKLLSSKGVLVSSFKDQVIFEKDEVMKNDGNPYTVYTPYKNKWLGTLSLGEHTKSYDSETLLANLYEEDLDFPELHDLGFIESNIKVEPYDLSVLSNYHKTRDYPAIKGTSRLSPYLRFGLLSIRQLVKIAHDQNPVFLSELIWREFFMQILFHFPNVVTHSFKKKYDTIKWRNNKDEFEKWCKGLTGYPMVDAGMRELNSTGYMHNRVRMVVAGFLCKHLLIDWRWGEAYFAEKLLDYELASNNGNWQWAAGTGCDAAPYFRIFNPTAQIKKFDKALEYINAWVPDLNDLSYPDKMVEQKQARKRALETYKKAIS